MVSQRYLLDQDKLDIIREADNLWNILVAKEM
jgi:hypothetical protein